MKLLFICTHNRCRSILAEAICNHESRGIIQAYSAGSSPQDHVHPLSLYYLQRSGVETDGLQSQSWNEFSELRPDAIITLCDTAAQESCPVWFENAVQVHWGLPDPSAGSVSDEERESKFVKTIDILKRRVRELTNAGYIDARGEDLNKKLVDIALRIH